MTAVSVAGATGCTGRAVVEVVFALPDERLVIRHDAGGTPTPYVAGTLLAIRGAPRRVGVVRGLDALLLTR